MLHLHFLWFCIFSTLYSSSLLTMSGGGASSMCYSLNWSSLYCVSRSSLNTLWITYSSSNSSWNTPWPISFVISKSLYLFWSSFLEDFFKEIFLASSHMLFPSFNSCKFYLFLSNCFFIVYFAISIYFFAASQLLCSPSRKLSNFGNFVFTIRSSFYRCYPKLSLNGV